MANVKSLIDQEAQVSSLWEGLPLGKDDAESGNRFLSAIVQYLLVNKYSGLMTTLPDSVSMFFRQTPQHPALGSGYARVSLGHALCWVMPKIEVGEQYKHIKPPIIPVREEKMKYEFKLQCSTALAVNQWRDKYINASVHATIVDFMPVYAKAAINNTIVEIFNAF